MVNRLLPSYAPPKEGRAQPFSPKLKKWQHSPQARIAVILFGILATYVILAPFFVTRGDILTSDRHPTTGLKQPASPKIPTGDEHRAPSWAQEEPIAKNEPEWKPVKTPPKQDPIRETKPYDQPKSKTPVPKGSTSRPKSNHYVQLEDEDEFLRKLRKVISLVPDEVNSREQLREPEGTGKERLREIGLRTRVFKTYFDAWEDLHLVTNGDISYIRDNVIQYLRTIMTGQQLTDSIHSYEQFRKIFPAVFCQSLPWTAPYWSDHMTMHAHIRDGGRGIVLSENWDVIFPIEIMYLGDSDLDDDYRTQLENLPGVITRDLSQMINDVGWRVRGWAGKPFAILMSSFREAIFIDADSLFFEDPAVLFNDPGYIETGALFFRDRKIMPESKKRWLQQLLPKPISRLAKQSYMWTGESGHYQESGVVVVDKWKHFVPMLLVTRMNGPDRDGNKDKGIIGIYDMVYGDKETYWLAWELCGDLGYSFHQGAAGIMGKVEDHRVPEPRKLSKEAKQHLKSLHPELDDEQVAAAMEMPTVREDQGPPTNFTICAPQLLHLNLDGSPLWFNGWLMAKKGDDKKDAFSKFDKYLAEPKEKKEDADDAWKLHTDNVCCLTADEAIDFTPKERKILDMIVEVAKDVKGKTDV